MVLEAKFQVIYDVFNLEHIPVKKEVFHLFALQKNFMLIMFQTHILTDQDKDIIATHIDV